MNMRMDSKRAAFIPLLITYVVVKLVHTFVGFEYDLLSEGLFNMKFVIDIASWAVVYAAVYFLLRKLLPQKGEALTK
ncbi:hypothetical protein [Pontibacter kalidii]|uniref:hypothetical protein n=1 Tax=Pontibacter kalidii TaxID=2592049 RepID=UPI002251FB24|nr:hypothetical protein [Pontibacter kalidii]